MSTSPDPSPVRSAVVLGGGVLGVSTATHLQRAGIRTALLTRGPLADGASGRSLSWLNSAGRFSPAYHRLRTVAVDRYRTLFAQDPHRSWLRFDGGVWWGADEDRAQQRHEEQVAVGYDSHLLAPDAAVTRFPGLVAPRTAVWNPGEGWVSLPHLVAHLAAEFTAAGGLLRTDAGPGHVLVEGGRARGVRTDDGQVVRADAVVVACGAQTPAVLGELGVALPDASPLSGLVETDPVEAVVPVVLNTPRAALRPTPSGGYAVDHDWYVDDVVEHPDGSGDLPPDVVRDLLAAASEVLGGTGLTARTVRAGRKPVPRDGEPVLGRLATVPGCHVAFTHSGATLGLLVGELLTHEVRTGHAHPLAAPFGPGRFGC